MSTKVLFKESSGIDLMMAIALVFILLCPFYWLFPQGNTMLSQIASLLHFFSIEAFLVLSGFIMGRMLVPIFEIRTFDFSSILAFLYNTLGRIIPFYFFALILNYLLAYSFGFPNESNWKYLFLLQNFFGPMPVFFSESWVIPIVVFASLFFPFFLYAYSEILKKNIAKSFLAVSVLLIVIPLFLKVYYNFSTDTSSINQWDRALKSVVVYRLDSVFIGVLFYWFQDQLHGFWIRFKEVFFALGSLGIFFISFGIGYFKILIDTHPLFWTVFYLPFVSLSIAFLLPFFSEIRLKNVFLKLVSFISFLFYPIYLFHFSVVLQTMCYFYPIGSLSTFGILIFLFLYIFITFFLSFILSLALKKIYFLTN